MILEIHKIPVFSTAHVDENTAEVLNGKKPTVPCAKWENGWFLFLDVANDASDSWPRCLVDIGWRLRVLEAGGELDDSRWVRLDVDGPKDNVLPTYEW